MNVDFSVLKGKIIKGIIKNHDEEIIFFISDDEVYRMYHCQSCCETVLIEDVCGDLNLLLNSPILIAEERTSDKHQKCEYHDEFMWTFYELATINGSVTIRWYGSSNGYYSVSVDFEKIKTEFEK